MERIERALDRIMGWLFGQGDVRRGAILGVGFGLLLTLAALLACVVFLFMLSRVR